MYHIRNNAFALTFLLVSTQSVADDKTFMSIEKYLHLTKTKPEVVETYLSGALAGYTLSNAMLERNNQKKLYCQPSEFSIDSKGLQNFIDAMVGKNLGIIGEAKADVAGLALWALVEAFPCK